MEADNYSDCARASVSVTSRVICQDKESESGGVQVFPQWAAHLFLGHQRAISSASLPLMFVTSGNFGVRLYRGVRIQELSI